jgi:hypothetical protein
MDWSVPPVVKYLLCKLKALSSNPKPTKKKKFLELDMVAHSSNPSIWEAEAGRS